MSLQEPPPLFPDRPRRTWRWRPGPDFSSLPVYAAFSLIPLAIVLLLSFGFASSSTQRRYAAYAIKGPGDRWIIVDRRPTEEELDAMKPGGPGSYAHLYEAMLIEDVDRFGWSLSEMAKRRSSYSRAPLETFDVPLGVKSTIALSIPGLLTPEEWAEWHRRYDTPPAVMSWIQPTPAETESLRAALLDHHAVEHARIVARLRSNELVVDSRPSTAQILLAGFVIVSSPIVFGALAAIVAWVLEVVRV